ncbi:hypothetical protein ABPG72_006738 [Tetrahymena utriculariae]
MNINTASNIQQADDAEFNDIILSQDMITNLGLDLPSNNTSVSHFIRQGVEQRLYPKSLPILVQSIREYVQCFKKYYDSAGNQEQAKQDAKQILKQELLEISTRTVFKLPSSEQVVTLAAGGVGALVGGLIPTIGLAAGGLSGVFIGCVVCCIFNKEITDFFLGPRSDLLLKAEKELGIDDIEYTLEELEEIYRTERPAYHPDRYRTIQEKKRFSKKFLKITESYEIIKQLKKWN